MRHFPQFAEKIGYDLDSDEEDRDLSIKVKKYPHEYQINKDLFSDPSYMSGINYFYKKKINA